MVTTNYVKVDMEDLEEPGLYVYEVVYDNKQGGQGVGAVITKLYPNAKTYTSNVRTNADGTLYRVKAQYEGAEVQMISIPSLNQVHLSPNNKITLMIDYATSLDEIDEKNAAEKDLFKPNPMMELSQRAIEYKKMRWDLLRAGSFTASGNLAYEIVSLDFGSVKYTPAKTVKLETTLFQNALKSNITSETKADFMSFLEANFPKGFNGTVQVAVKGMALPLPVKIGLQTIKTLEANGTKIIKNASEALANEVLARFKNGTLKEGVGQ